MPLNMTCTLPAVLAAAYKHEFSTSPHLINETRTEPLSMASLFQRLHALSNLTTLYSSKPPESELLGESISRDSTAVESAHVLEFSRKDSLIASSTTGSASVVDAHRKPSKRPKSSFQFAHPPPTTKHKHRFITRPKLLLQLRQIADDRRPVPVLDVLPSTVFVPRIARRFPRILNGRTGLGPDDLVVVSSHTHDSFKRQKAEEEDSSEDESLDNREVVAAICQLGKREDGNYHRTEIYLDHGPSWESSLMVNGAYEFFSVGDNGDKTTVRWVPKVAARRRKNSDALEVQPIAGMDEKKFNFSIINPNSRRHPIVASLNRKTIDIFDHYTIPSTPATLPDLNSPRYTPTDDDYFQQPYFDEPDASAKIQVDTDERMKTLIIATGIWVAFVEGWSVDISHSVSPSLASIKNSSPSKSRAFSTNLDNRSGSRVNTPLSFGSANSRHASINILHRSTASTTVNSAGQSLDSTPKRANSAGAAFLHLANSRRVHTSQSPRSASPSKDRIADAESSLRRRRTKSVSSAGPELHTFEVPRRVPSNIAEDGENLRERKTPVSYTDIERLQDDSESPRDAILNTETFDHPDPRALTPRKRPKRLDKYFGFIKKRSSKRNQES